jgi:hypothetical protein
MSLPPSYESLQPSPQKEGKTQMILVLAMLGGGTFCCLLGAAILFPVFGQARDAARTTVCMRNQRAMAAAMIQYATDNDGALPSGDRWRESIALYDPDAPIRQCPAVQSGAGTGYAFAANLASTKLNSTSDSAQKPMLFDSAAAGTDAISDLSSLPNPGRHVKGGRCNIVTFADGHTDFKLDAPAR